LYLLVDCYLETDNTAAAEQAIIKLVEQEPGNYPKFLDLVKIYLKNGELNAATRILSLASEHLLVGGQSQEFLDWTNEVLTRNPEQTEALRLVVRFHSWQRNETGLKEALERLAETANAIGEVEDERYALSQLILIAPQQTEFARRLQEISTLYGFEAPSPVEVKEKSEAPIYENFDVAENLETNGQSINYQEYSFAEVHNSFEFEQNGTIQNESSNGKEFEFYNNALQPTIVSSDYQAAESEFFDQAAVQFEQSAKYSTGDLKPADELKLQKELDSIEFYISQGYHDLAAKSLDELEEQFGWRAQFDDFRRQMNGSASKAETSSFTNQIFEPTEQETREKEKAIEPEPSVKVKSRKENNSRTKDFENIDELKSELGFEEFEEQASDDYDTHYHLATAYKEMGLMEDAIKEFQDAINRVEMNDGTRRYFQCANLLGHCFMEKGMPNLAIMWFQRGLLVENLKDDEKHAIYYELGNAFEAGGEMKDAVGHFEKLYSENVDYRDVSQRLDKLHKETLTYS
jgi:tetratricopeptide (TPR) repeat protein